MSSFDLAAVTAELNNLIRGSRIGKIYQINHKILLLKLRHPKGGKPQLLIEAGRRIHLTSYNFEKPKKPPNFCMALRKYLETGIIDSITQYDFERILEIVIKRGGKDYRLIVEFFNKGNIILVNSENRILHALTYRKMRDRSIMRNEEFKYPPQRGMDPRHISLEDLSKIRDFGRTEIVRALTKLLGIGGFYAEEILLRASVDKSEQCSSLSDEELNAIFKSIRTLISQVESGSYEPCLFADEHGEPVDAAPFPLKKYSNLQIIKMETFNKALDEYHVKRSVESGRKRVEDAAWREIARLERILEEQRKRLEELEAKAKAYRQIGDAIYSHLYYLSSLISRVMSEKKSGKSWDEISKEILREKERSIPPSTYFLSINPKTLAIRVSANGQAFNLNLKMSAQQNAAEYYERAKKAEDKIKGIKKAMKETRAKIEKAKTEAFKRIEAASKPPSIRRKKEWYEKFRWFFSSDGFLVIGGKDASTNEIIIKKHVEPHDLIFHADIQGSPFAVVKTLGKTPTEETINEAACFTASYSRAWKEHLRAINVYWVKPEQVSKSPPSGQYLPKGSFMIYGKKNYVRNVPLEIAIGVKREEDSFRIIGGPVNAISKQTNLYVRLIPGKKPSGKLAKEIRIRLLSMAPPEEREEISKIPIEEIQAFIPSGLGSIS